jgi:hypothetical protein
MICERAIGKHAQQIVNNFAANRAATVSDWPFGSIFGIGLHRFPHRRVRPANDQSL